MENIKKEQETVEREGEKERIRNRPGTTRIEN